MGSTHPYYRKRLPKPQIEPAFLSNLSLKQVVKRLRRQGVLPRAAAPSVKDLDQRFQPLLPGSMRSLLVRMLANVERSSISLANAQTTPYGVSDPVAEANRLFDARAAAAVSTAANSNIELLERKEYVLGSSLVHVIQEVYIPRAKCLAIMAYPDYFPGTNLVNLQRADRLRRMVSEAILAASPGYCGTFGPGVDAATDVADIFKDHYEGNYDMSQMRLLPLAYRYYDDLLPEAREHLITELLACGRIHRVRLDDTFTSGVTPRNWSSAGFVSPGGIAQRIGETENHSLMVLTARYLTNQLLYQRDHNPIHDNRRNGYHMGPNEGLIDIVDPVVLPVENRPRPHCTEVLLYVLRNILSDDFSEYNAKPYQTETRMALLNLCSYAYDHEVRLAARMVLDYISAHVAVSSNDLRRMVPFRRKNSEDYVTNSDGVMDVGLLYSVPGGDPMALNFAMQAGNTRAYDGYIMDDGTDATMEVLSDYRIPPSIHDLFVNDLSRRFFQRLHRSVQHDVEVTGRNCDNMEIYAGSPSYLISAGGTPATYAVDPGLATWFAKGKRKQAQQLGVAVTTSFMPTGSSAGLYVQNDRASALIQFSTFSDMSPLPINNITGVANYGVAPDFACGHRVYLPDWCKQAIVPGPRGKLNFDFVNKRGADGRPGFYLAFLRDGDLTAMEAFDTWLHPGVKFEQFMSDVWEKNKHLSESGLSSNVEAQYTTQNGNRLCFVIWNHLERNRAVYGAQILCIEYSDGDPKDTLVDAGHEIDPFLRGTVMNSREEGVVEITNPFLGTKITLDMSDPWHPRRTSETGEVEEAGSNHEVWVDFAWTGPGEGDFFHPFRTLAEATAAVANGGVIKIMPGSSNERHIIRNDKRVRLVAPIGGVTIGVR